MVYREGDEYSTFDHFINEWQDRFPDEIKNIYATLFQIGKMVGPAPGFFKSKEGRPGDRVECLFDFPHIKLRLFCINLRDVIILGDGGEKTADKWDDCPNLRPKGDEMVVISREIMALLATQEMRYSIRGTELEGTLKNYEDEVR